MAPPRLQQRFRDEIAPQLLREFSYGNPMQVPRVKKVLLNIGLGEATQDSKVIDAASDDLAVISGQKPVITKARRSIANFKVREGHPAGVAGTLRGDRRWEVLDRWVKAALRGIRDFGGVSRKAFDGRGNFSLGVREQLIFPEIDYDKVDRVRGLQVNIVTSAVNDEEGARLLELLGMPFSKE